MAPILISCQIGYIVKSAYSQADLLMSRVPIDEAIQNPALTPEHKRKLELSQKAREFAEKNLGLKHTKNYTSFVDLKRPYVTWVVSAAPKNILEHHLFWFPILGSMPYKGFFNPKDAQDFADSLKAQGLDIYVRGVSAYSTLGWFNDPLLSSMLRGQDHELVNTIIHETVHATVFIKSAADFNERLASFIGDIGTELFYKDRGAEGQATLSQIQEEDHDQRIFTEFISNEINELKKWYQSEEAKGAASLEILRQKKFADIQTRFKDVQPKFKRRDAYAGFLKTEINNARLLTFRLYMQDMSDFQKAFQNYDKDFGKFLNFCKGLEKSESPLEDLKNAGKN
jgi:predicted aminopeptidase